MKLWSQSLESNIYLIHIPYTVQSEKIEIFKIEINISSASSDKYNKFKEQMAQISDELNHDYLKKYPYSQSDVIPGIIYIYI